MSRIRWCQCRGKVIMLSESVFKFSLKNAFKYMEIDQLTQSIVLFSCLFPSWHDMKKGLINHSWSYFFSMTWLRRRSSMKIDWVFMYIHIVISLTKVYLFSLDIFALANYHGRIKQQNKRMHNYFSCLSSLPLTRT